VSLESHTNDLTKIYSFLMGVRPYFYDDCDQSFYNRAEEIEEEVRNSAHREVCAPSTPAASYRQKREAHSGKNCMGTCTNVNDGVPSRVGLNP
jgi:hypothetical protein